MNQTPQTETMDQTIVYIYREMIEPFVPEFITNIGYVPWMFSLIGSALVGLAGILPLLVIPVDVDGGVKESDIKDKDPANSKTLKILLSFAVGGLLGDVFLHLLPEAWEGDQKNGVTDHSGHQHPSMRSGMWVLGGVLLFTIVEKIFSGYVNADENNPQPKCVEIANCLLRRSKETGEEVPEGATCCATNGGDIEDISKQCFLAHANNNKATKEQASKKVTGYLNLLANSIDNFTHGLAVASSFLISFRHGALATFAILLHEIPHEVGDFAILLRSGFSRWDAARAQLLTAGAGLLGALAAIFGSSVTSAMEARTSWVMPFTAGGFLHIALVTVLPDLLKEDDPKESVKQFVALITGISLMAFMTVALEH